MAKQLQRLKTDHGKRIADINTELTRQLANKTSFQTELNKVHLTAANLAKSHEEMEHRLNSLPGIDYYDDQLQSLQTQITGLAKGLPTGQAMTPRHIQDNSSFQPKPQPSKQIKSNKLGSSLVK